VRISGARGWGGIAVQGTRTEPRRVLLEHTTVRGGSGSQNERTYFTTPFAVHDGIVRIRSSRFLDASVEDGVNLKNAEVDLEDNLFSGAMSDALDCDFCTGSLVGNRFLDIGGDALDFSGSQVEVRGNRVTRCGDKGISVGERTQATIEDNEIAGCTTGIAVKDRSDVVMQNNRLSDLQVGVALYVKKQTFGPSRARVAGLELRNVASDFVRESGCVLELEDT
jgi:parallel beta-helix repeat protein